MTLVGVSCFTSGSLFGYLLAIMGKTSAEDLCVLEELEENKKENKKDNEERNTSL